MSAPTRTRWQEVALPREHGGWSLTAEPILLGLIVAWSAAGLALGLAAMVAFVARTPVKVVLVDRWRGRWLDRTTLAARIAGIEVASIIGLGIVAGSASDDPRLWVPLIVAAPLIAVELWFDMRSRSRRLVPELAGTVGIGSVAAAIALAGGREASLAVGLWVVVAARAAAAIPLVRSQLDRVHGRPVSRWPSDAAQGLAVLVVGVVWAVGWVPVAAVVVLAAVAVFGVVSLRLPARPAVVIGVQQVVIGLAVVLVTAIAVRMA
jgi:hypothetical protein